LSDANPTLEDRLRLLESCVRGIVMEFDASGRYLEVWTHDPSLLARPRAELLGATLEEVFGVDGGAVFMNVIRRVCAERQPVRLEYPLTVLSGARWFGAEGFPGTKPGTVVLLVQDITERKQMEARLLEADRLAAIGVLAGGLGHEINNPLAWMMTQLSNLQREVSARAAEGSPELARWSHQLGETLEGADRIRQIVRDLAFFTRSPETESATFELSRALDWAASVSAAELRPRARLVKVYGASPLVTASEARLGQVFLNLIINAAHSIDEGSAERHEVRLELSVDADGRAQVDVVDTGRGIAAEHLDRLFDPFFTTKARGEGTGLGLTVSRRIIEDLGGTIGVVSSRPGETRFRVTLPRAKGTVAAPPAAAKPEVPTRRLRVLLVDDQERFLATLAVALGDGMDVVTETSARQALAKLAAGERFDAVVCDLMMPELTGMDFYEELQRSLPAMVQRLVFMTGGAFSPRAREFLEQTKVPRLEKPFRPGQLEALLARVCQSS